MYPAGGPAAAATALWVTQGVNQQWIYGCIFAQMLEDIGETGAETFRAGGQGLRASY
jgi:hypothetical protein